MSDGALELFAEADADADAEADAEVEAAAEETATGDSACELGVRERVDGLRRLLEAAAARSLALPTSGRHDCRCSETVPRSPPPQ